MCDVKQFCAVVRSKLNESASEYTLFNTVTDQTGGSQGCPSTQGCQVLCGSKTDHSSGSNSNSLGSSKCTSYSDEDLQVDRVVIQANQHLLLTTWNDDFEQLFQLGSDIYLAIFRVDPSAMDLFPGLQKYPGTTWMESKEFRCQALRFVQVLSHCVKNLKDCERLDPLLLTVGQKHVKLETSRGFKAVHWDIFEEAIRLTMESRLTKHPDLNDTQKKAAVMAWQALARYIVGVMKKGFYAGGGSE